MNYKEIVEEVYLELFKELEQLENEYSKRKDVIDEKGAKDELTLDEYYDKLGELEDWFIAEKQSKWDEFLEKLDEKTGARVLMDTIDSWVPFSGIGFKHTYYRDRIQIEKDGKIVEIDVVWARCDVYGRITYHLEGVKAREIFKPHPLIQKLLNIYSKYPVRYEWQERQREIIIQMNEEIMKGANPTEVLKEKQKQLSRSCIYEDLHLASAIRELLETLKAKT